MGILRLMTNAPSLTRTPMERIVYDNWVQIFEYVSTHENHVQRLRCVNKFFRHLVGRWQKSLLETTLPNLAIDYDTKADQYSLYVSRAFWTYLHSVEEDPPYNICDFTYDEGEFRIIVDGHGYATVNLPESMCDRLNLIPSTLNGAMSKFKGGMRFLSAHYHQHVLPKYTALRSLQRLY